MQWNHFWMKFSKRKEKVGFVSFSTYRCQLRCLLGRRLWGLQQGNELTLIRKHFWGKKHLEHGLLEKVWQDGKQGEGTLTKWIWRRKCTYVVCCRMDEHYFWSRQHSIIESIRGDSNALAFKGLLPTLVKETQIVFHIIYLGGHIQHPQMSEEQDEFFCG